MAQPRTESSTLAPLTLGAGSFLVRGCPVHCGLFSSPSRLYPRNASSAPGPAMTTENVSRHSHMSPGQKCQPHWEQPRELSLQHDILIFSLKTQLHGPTTNIFPPSLTHNNLLKANKTHVSISTFGIFFKVFPR